MNIPDRLSRSNNYLILQPRAARQPGEYTDASGRNKGFLDMLDRARAFAGQPDIVERVRVANQQWHQGASMPRLATGAQPPTR